MLINLQSNALKFTREGGTIEIECEFIRGIYEGDDQMKKAYKSKLLQKFKESYSSLDHKSDGDSDTDNSEASDFEKAHQIDHLF